MDDAVWNHAVFSKDRDRLLTSEVALQFFAEVNQKAKKSMSDEHFTVDGTLIQAWASQKRTAQGKTLQSVEFQRSPSAADSAQQAIPAMPKPATTHSAPL